MILTYVFIKHTYGARFLRSTSCSLALSSSSFVFSVSDSVLSVVRVSLGCASTSCAAISTRKHKVRGGEECFVGERRAGTRRRAWRRSARMDDAAGVTSWGTHARALSLSFSIRLNPQRATRVCVISSWWSIFALSASARASQIPDWKMCS